VHAVEDEEYERPSLRSRGCGYLGCLLVIALLVALGVGAFALGNALEPVADRFLWRPHDVVSTYFDAHQRGDMDRARRFLCEGVRQPLDPLTPLGTRVGRPYVDDEIPFPRPGGRVAIYYRADEHGPQAQALLEREDGGWRICAFE
jgi:hypothetical protein